MFSRRRHKNYLTKNAAPVAPVCQQALQGPESLQHTKQQRVLAKIREFRADFLAPFHLNNIILKTWLNCREGNEFTVYLTQFRRALLAVLNAHSVCAAYETAIHGEAPVILGDNPPQTIKYNHYAKKGLHLYRETSHLLFIFERCPALVDFLHQELCEKTVLLEVQQAYQKHLVQVSSWVVLNNIILYFEKNKNKLVHPAAWNSTSQVALSLQNTEDRGFFAAPHEYEEALNSLLNTKMSEASLNDQGYCFPADECEEALNAWLNRKLPFDYHALKHQIVSQRIIKAIQLQQYNKEKSELEKFMLRVRSVTSKPGKGFETVTEHARPRR